MNTASLWIDKQRQFWNASFDRLDHLLERPPESESPQ
jgi:hypothetical protein